jgi:hypothetical protein
MVAARVRFGNDEIRVSASCLTQDRFIWGVIPLDRHRNIQPPPMQTSRNRPQSFLVGAACAVVQISHSVLQLVNFLTHANRCGNRLKKSEFSAQGLRQLRGFRNTG